jgi:hypothetical protein
VVAASTRSGSASELINTTLSAGIYYVQVSAANSTTAYTLNVAASPVPVNVAPTNLQFGLSKTVYKATENLTIANAWVYDANGATDLARVDFKLRKADGTVIDLSDATSFAPYTYSPQWAGFNYSLNLKDLAAGNYTLQAIAYDKAGLASSLVSREFKLEAPNFAPEALRFELSKQTFLSTETLSVVNGAVFDANGAIDLARVDFKLVRADGSILDVSDAVSFTAASDTRLANFSYSLSLKDFAAGNYSLRGVAFDRSGASGNLVSQHFTIQADIDPWLSANLRDRGLIDLTNTLAKDGQLVRTDMIALFRNAGDQGIVDATELLDLQTIVNNAVRFQMLDHVRVLSSKIAHGTIANVRAGIGNLVGNSTLNQLERLIGKWFLGNDRPAAPGGYTLTYREFKTGSLFGNDNQFSYQDVKQGYLGDCYFLASLAANAQQRPSNIREMFIDNGDGTFTVRLYGQTNGKIAGAADYLTVDRWLPTNVSANGYTGQRFAYFDEANVGLWVALAEKAYAQFAESGVTQRDFNLNSYGEIEGGWGYRAMPSISGISGGYYAGTSWSNTGPRTGEFPGLAAIDNLLKSGKALTADTGYYTTLNIVQWHEYMVVGVDLSRGTVTLYNPWGVTRSGETNGIRTLSYNDFKLNFNIVNVA